MVQPQTKPNYTPTMQSFKSYSAFFYREISDIDAVCTMEMCGIVERVLVNLGLQPSWLGSQYDQCI